MKLSHTLFLLLSLLGSTPIRAVEEAPLGRHLDDLLDYARTHNPTLAATQHEAEAARLRTEAEGSLPDPVLRAELMDITHQGTTGPRFAPTQTGATRYLLMQTLPWFGKRDLQHDVAESQHRRAEAQAVSSWAALAAAIKQAYAMHYYATASERLIRQTLSALQALEQVALTRYASGRGTQQDVLRIQIERSRLERELIGLQNEAHHAHARLNALLSRPVNATLEEPAAPRPMPNAAQLDESTLLQRLQTHNPQLQGAEADLAGATQRRELAYAKRYPDLTLGIAPTQRGSAIRSWDVMVQLDIPLQQSSRRAQEGEAEASLAAATARQHALQDRLRAALSESLSALSTAQDTEALIRTRLIPQAELTYQSALAGYETGKVSFEMLVDAQTQSLKAKQEHLQAQTEMQSRLADIETLLGEEL